MPNLIFIQRQDASPKNQRKYTFFFNRRKYTAAATKKSEEVCQLRFPSTASMSQLKNQKKYAKFNFPTEEVCHNEKIRGSMPNLIFIQRKYDATQKSEKVC